MWLKSVLWSILAEHILGSKVVRSYIFTDNSRNGKVPKLQRNINIHSGLVNSNFHIPRNLNVFIFMISGTGGHVKGPLKPLFLKLDPPDSSNHFKKNPKSFLESITS